MVGGTVRKLWKVKVKVILVAMGAHGAIPRSLEKYLDSTRSTRLLNGIVAEGGSPMVLQEF